MRKYVITITITIIILLTLVFLYSTKKTVHKQRIKDYSDVEVTKYTLQEWEDLGVNVWEKYYSPERWEAIKAKSSWVDDYELGWKSDLDFVLKQKGLVKDNKKIEIWAKPLYEEILPIKRWFWGYDKIRILSCEYTIVYNGKKLRTFHLSLPPTERKMVQK